MGILRPNLFKILSYLFFTAPAVLAAVLIAPFAHAKHSHATQNSIKAPAEPVRAEERVAYLILFKKGPEPHRFGHVAFTFRSPTQDPIIGSTYFYRVVDKNSGTPPSFWRYLQNSAEIDNPLVLRAYKTNMRELFSNLANKPSFSILQLNLSTDEALEFEHRLEKELASSAIAVNDRLFFEATLHPLAVLNSVVGEQRAISISNSQDWNLPRLKNFAAHSDGFLSRLPNYLSYMLSGHPLVKRNTSFWLNVPWAEYVYTQLLKQDLTRIADCDLWPKSVLKTAQFLVVNTNEKQNSFIKTHQLFTQLGAAPYNCPTHDLLWAKLLIDLQELYR